MGSTIGETVLELNKDWDGLSLQDAQKITQDFSTAQGDKMRASQAEALVAVFKDGIVDPKEEVWLKEVFGSRRFEQEFKEITGTNNRQAMKTRFDWFAKQHDTHVKKAKGDSFFTAEMPKEASIQGVPCGKGEKLEFYFEGQLKSAKLSQDAAVQNLPCQKGSKVEFYSNGQIKSATLSIDYVIEDKVYKAGDRVHLDENGSVLKATS